MPRIKNDDDLKALSKIDPAIIASAIRNHYAKGRDDLPTFFELVMRHEETQEPLQVLPHQRLMFEFALAHRRCVIRQPVETTKCVTGDTKVACHESGKLIDVEKFVKTMGHSSVASWTPGGGIAWNKTAGGYATGTKDCIRIKMRTGRYVDTTPEHPYLTPEGWRRADQLLTGDTVGIAGRVPWPQKMSSMSPEAILLLALLFAEGSTTKDATFSTTDQEMLRRARNAAEKFDTDITHRSSCDYAITKRPGSGRRNPVISLIRDHGLFGCKSIEKTIPPAIFSLPPADLSLFLSIVWMCDGMVDRIVPSITLASEQAIDELQHLLLRFGIQSSKHSQIIKRDGKKYFSWKLTVRMSTINQFAESIKLWGDKASRLEVILAKKRNPTTGFPVVSRAFQDKEIARIRAAGINAPTLRRVMKWRSHATLLETMFCPTDRGNGRRGLARGFWVACELAQISDHEWMRNSDIFWDEIVDISPAGTHPVFDLTVPLTSCFLANDIIAHNTWSVASMLIWLLGVDPIQRNMILSRTEAQGKKILSAVKAYIVDGKLSRSLRLVFPNLKPQTGGGEKWATNQINIQRPGGLRDASVLAVGAQAKSIGGSRINNIVCDDLIDPFNSSTKTQRDELYDNFFGVFLSRLKKNGRCIITNTPWNRDDLTYRLEREGWPTLTMNILGFIKISNTKAHWMARALDSLIRPSDKYMRGGHDWYRLRAFDPDPNEETPLWPEQYSEERIEELQKDNPPHKFAQLYMCEPLSIDDLRCKPEWIEKCKLLGIGLKPMSRYDGPNRTYTGLDLAVGKRKHNDLSVFFTFELKPDGTRRILQIESGRWDGPDIVKKMVQKANAFHSLIRVETNAGQDWLRQFAIEARKDLRIMAHTTTRANKQDKEFGVESVFAELEQGSWIIPCDENGRCNREIQAWIDDCLYYQPDIHTSDRLIACWLAREGARKAGRGRYNPRTGQRRSWVDSPY